MFRGYIAALALVSFLPDFFQLNPQDPKNDPFTSAPSTSLNFPSLMRIKGILKDPVNSTNNWPLTPRLAFPRRNHDCAIVDNQLVSFGGRYGREIESMNLLTGEVKIAPGPVEIHHFLSALVDSIEFENEKEIWIPCGYATGAAIDKEGDPLSTVVIIDPRTLSIREGPAIPQEISSTACGVLAVEVEAGKPPHICVFGGSVGTHNKGTFKDTIGCYDRLNKKWDTTLFGRLPVVADHLNIAFIPQGTCCEYSPDKLILINYRSSAYGTSPPDVFALDLKRDVDGFLRPTAKGWAKIGQVNPMSAAVATPYGRYIFSFGGINHYRVGRVRKDKGEEFVNAFDVCTGTEHRGIDKIGGGMRFAHAKCSSEMNHLAFLCGGHAFPQYRSEYGNVTYGDGKSRKDCELFDLKRLAGQLTEKLRKKSLE